MNRQVIYRLTNRRAGSLLITAFTPGDVSQLLVQLERKEAVDFSPLQQQELVSCGLQFQVNCSGIVELVVLEKPVLLVATVPS